ncbi:MAG: DUF1566 domain-containing protein [Syntrophobacteraceae bacterium]|nr:DUF1566 domain-containing protein [Syntrophobacteraceae bacterium]
MKAVFRLIRLVGLSVTFLFVLTAALPHASQAYRLPDTGQHKCYNSMRRFPCPDPGEPYYGQDAHYQGPRPAYRDNGNGTVTDLNTGLVWQQGDDQNGTHFHSSYYTWREAMDYCGALDLAGYKDWRLPGLMELESLVHYGRRDPAVNTKVFPGCRSDGYWSSNRDEIYPEFGWIVSFWAGHSFVSYTTGGRYVRCVRGGS